MDNEYIKFPIKPFYKIFFVFASLAFLLFSIFCFICIDDTLVRVEMLFFFLIGIFLYFFANVNIKIYKEKFSILNKTYYFDQTKIISFQKRNRTILKIQTNNKIKRLHIIKDLYYDDKIIELLLDNNKIEYVLANKSKLKKSYSLEIIISIFSSLFCIVINVFLLIFLNKFSLNYNLKTFIVISLIIFVYNMSSIFFANIIFKKKFKEYSL